MKDRLFWVLTACQKRTGIEVIALVLLISLLTGATTISATALSGATSSAARPATYIQPEDILSTEELRKTFEDDRGFSTKIDEALWKQLGYLQEEAERDVQPLQDAQPCLHFTLPLSHAEEYAFTVPVVVLEQMYRMDITNREHLDLYVEYYLRKHALRRGWNPDQLAGGGYTVVYGLHSELVQ